MNYMRYRKKLSWHYDRGVEHGLKGINKPGFIYGSFKRLYMSGVKQGQKLRKPKK